MVAALFFKAAYGKRSRSSGTSPAAVALSEVEANVNAANVKATILRASPHHNSLPPERQQISRIFLINFLPRKPTSRASLSPTPLHNHDLQKRPTNESLGQGRKAPLSDPLFPRSFVDDSGKQQARRGSSNLRTPFATGRTP